jgi:EmrB/QacA subfamily drug resistance transporter
MRKWWPLVGISLGTFMLLVDITIVTVAMPGIADDLTASFSALQWVLDGYALALAALLLGAGSLADRFGRRAVYLAGLGVFAAASLVCALAPGAGFLVAARVVQGVGGAAMFATTVALITATYDGRDRGVAFGVWGAVNGAAAAAGPLLGGVLVEYVGWRSIFWVNLPITVVAVVVTVATIRESRNPAASRLDLPGIVTFTAGASAVVYALTRGEGDGWASPGIVGALVGGAVLLAAFVVIEARGRHAMLDVRLFRRRAFTGVMLGALIVQGAAFAYLAYASLWVQTVLGVGAVRAGFALVPMAIAAFVVSAAVGRFLHGRPPGGVVAVGALLIGVGAFAQATIGSASSALALVPGLVVAGVGVGLATPVLVSAALSAVPPERAGMASGAVNTMRQLGFALGVALFGVIFQTRAGGVLSGGGLPGARPVEALSSGRAGSLIAAAPQASRAAVAHLVRAAFASGLNAVYVAAGIGGVVACGIVLVLVRRPAAGGSAEPKRERQSARVG